MNFKVGDYVYLKTEEQMKNNSKFRDIRDEWKDILGKKVKIKRIEIINGLPMYYPEEIFFGFDIERFDDSRLKIELLLKELE